MLEIIESIGIKPVESNQKLIRVFTEDKYKNLFEDSAIWFSNIDSLKAEIDPCERKIPDKFFEEMTSNQKETYKKINEFKDECIKSYVSCWSMEESASQWETYDKEKRGLAVVTSVEKFLAVFGKDVICIEPQYINYKEDSCDLPWAIVEDNCGHHRTIRIKEHYKGIDYSDDREIRFIYFDYDVSEGNNYKVNLDEIIDYIIFNPKATDEVKRSIRAYLRDKNVVIKEKMEN